MCAALQGAGFQSPNDAAYALANYGHSCTALLGFYPFYFCLFCHCVHKKIKSCNLMSGFADCTGI
jgi:hypothetical protein